MPTVSDILSSAAAILHSAGITEPRREAASLLSFTLRKDKTFLIAHAEYVLTRSEELHYNGLVVRRSEREPFQHITGIQEFFGLDFIVSPDVLIPRPETETIVEKAIEFLRPRSKPRFCEIGVGSGCISISILHEIETANAIGVDISEKALAIASRNSEKQAVSDRIELKISDVFTEIPSESFDLIVSNPPYIPADEIGGLQPEVRDFEPLNALTDGSDGLSLIEKIVVESPGFLKSKGLLIMEIGIGQADAVTGLFDRNIWASVEIIPDLQNIPRTVIAERF